MTQSQSAPSVPNLARENAASADPAFVAKLQQAANLANENCDRATALAHTLSDQLREAQSRIRMHSQSHSSADYAMSCSTRPYSAHSRTHALFLKNGASITTSNDPTRGSAG